MTRARWCLVLGLMSSCTRPAPSHDDDPRYTCRVPMEPLRAALREAGGDVARVIRPGGAGDLARLDVDKRHRFVVDGADRLAISPTSDEAGAPYVHPILGDGRPVRAAGGMRVTHAGGVVTRVLLDAESYAYCTSAESLRVAVRAVVALGVDASRVEVEGRPFACVDMGSQRRRYGTVMPSVARRHELLGRALAAGQWELAEYALHELDEELDELEGAAQPGEVHVDLTPIAQSFGTQYVRPMERALEHRDAAAASAAYAGISQGCNNCHTVAGKGYITISPTPGDAQPHVAPAPSTAPPVR